MFLSPMYCQAPAIAILSHLITLDNALLNELTSYVRSSPFLIIIIMIDISDGYRCFKGTGNQNFIFVFVCYSKSVIVLRGLNASVQKNA